MKQVAQLIVMLLAVAGWEGAAAQSAPPTWSTAAKSPAAAASTGDGFVVGQGDVVRIAVFQNPDLTLETRVDASGRISFPFLGQLDVGGKTPTQIEAMIAAGLEERQVLKRPQVTVVVPQFRSQQISVLGNVNRPGRFPLDVPMTLSDALAMAGGVAQTGADSLVLSRQQDGKVRNTEIDVASMFVAGRGRGDDVPLKSGDVIYVHRFPVIYIYGEVQRPGAFRLERDMTIVQALSLGGGLTPRGTERGIKITRRLPEGRTVMIDGKVTMLLEADDVIYVRESMF